MKTLCIYILLIAGIITIISYQAYHYYAPPYHRTVYSVLNHDDTLRIAYIGDSWAFIHKNYECNLAKILEDTIHRPAKVHSFGICGLTSKEIYEGIFDNYLFKDFFLERGYNYCFVSAGINDTYKKMSTDYYQKSMEGIIEFLLANKIHPIILEIPNYDIIKSYNRQTPIKKAIRQLSMLITCCPINCKQQFRNAFEDLINQKGYKGQVGIIRYKTWNKGYSEDLINLYRSDGLHLNEKGYEKLDSVISSYIVFHEYKKEFGARQK